MKYEEKLASVPTEDGAYLSVTRRERGVRVCIVW